MSEFNSAYMQINTGGGTYQDSYLRVKSLSDGKGGGIGGHWGGNDFTDTISNSGARGRSRMYSGKQEKLLNPKIFFPFYIYFIVLIFPKFIASFFFFLLSFFLSIYYRYFLQQVSYYICC